MTMWTLWAVNEIEPAAGTILMNTNELPVAERKPAAVTVALDKLAAPQQILEDKLAKDGGYLVGRRFTVADLNLVCCLFYLRHAPQGVQPIPAPRRTAYL